MPSPDATFLHGPVDEAAPRLLGWVLRTREVAVRITEVEAYGGADDAGSHARNGATRRNATMFAEAGRLYCYLSYGMHVCANVVTGPRGSGAAVLLRAGEVVLGEEVARTRRGTATDRDLARGPARLTRALGLGLDLDGQLLVGSDGPVWLEAGHAPAQVARGPRVGLTGAPDRPWRWWCEGDPSVSTYRRSPRADPPI